MTFDEYLKSPTFLKAYEKHKAGLKSGQKAKSAEAFAREQIAGMDRTFGANQWNRPTLTPEQESSVKAEARAQSGKEPTADQTYSAPAATTSSGLTRTGSDTYTAPSGTVLQNGTVVSPPGAAAAFDPPRSQGTQPPNTAQSAQTGTYTPPLTSGTAGGTAAPAGGGTLGANAYESLKPVFIQQFPGVDLSSPAGQQQFNAWTGVLMEQNGVGRWEDLPTSAVPSVVTGGGQGGAGGGFGGGGVGLGGGPAIVDTELGTFRDLGNETANTLAAQIGMAPAQFQAYSQFAPQYAQLEQDLLRKTLFGNFDAGIFERDNPGFWNEYQTKLASGELQGWSPEQYAAAYKGLPANDPSLNQYFSGGMNSINQFLTQQANQQTVDSNTALRAGNMADASAFGPQALQLLQSLNPNQYAALNQAQQSATTGMGPNQYQNQLGNQFSQGAQFQSVNAPMIGAQPQVRTTGDPLLGLANYDAATSGFSPLGMDLTSMARQQLALGGGLSDEQRRNAEQAAREAWAARGLVNSMGAVGAEVLNKDAYAQQLLAQRQGFAQNVNQLEQADMARRNQYTLGVLGANQGAQGHGLQAQMANLGAGLDVARLNQGASMQGQLANQGAGLQAQQLNNALGLSLAGMDYGRQQQNFGNLFSNAQLQAGSAFNPFALTGATTANAGSNAGMFGMGGGITSGGTANQNVMNQFNPFNGYAANLYGQNYGALNDARANADEVSAGKQAGWLNFAGNLIGGIIPG